MTYVVELSGYSIAGSSVQTLRYAMGAGVAFSDTTYAPGYLKSWKSSSQQIEIGSTGKIGVRGDQGQLVLVNVPTTIDDAGPLDALCTAWAWAGRQVRLYWVPGTTWSAKTLVAFGVLEQPIASMQANTITFPIRDPRAGLSAPLTGTTYLGDNSAGAGVEGEADLKGHVKPVLYGIVSNIPGIRVNAQKLIYQLSDKAAAVICVRDGGGAYTAGTSRGSLASLQSNDPGIGKYDYYSGTEGLFVRLGSTPIYQVTFDAKEGANASDRTHGQIWERIRNERSTLVADGGVAASVDGTSSDDLDALADKEVGFWWPESTTLEAAIGEVLESLSGYEVLGYDNLWRIYRLDPPDGDTTVFDLKVLRPSTIVGTKDRFLSGLSFVRPTFAPNGSPACKVNVQWGRNYTLMAATDFSGVVNTSLPRLKDKYAMTWRVETAVNTTVWDQVNKTGRFPNAPELTISTGYQPGADDLTCPHAATEASRLIGIYGEMRTQYACSFRPEPTDQILPGDVVSITHPQFDLSGGGKFRVLQAQLVVEDGVASMALVAGLKE